MTIAKPKLLDARALMIKHLNRVPGTGPLSDLDPEEFGIVGGPAHIAAGTSYHLGKDDLQLSKEPYSVYESPRDRNGLSNYASAVDIGDFSITVDGKRHDLRSFSIWLVAQCKAGTADTQDIREVIYSPDGQVVRRWDRLGIRTSGDSSHLWHTHISEFRDGTGARMVVLFTRYLTEIGVIVALTSDDIKAVSDATAAKVLGRAWSIAGRTLAGSVEALINYGQRDADLFAQVLAAIVADPGNTINLPPEQVNELALLLAAQLPDAEDVRTVVDAELDEQSRAGADADT